jgi:hypothetical protein
VRPQEQDRFKVFDSRTAPNAFDWVGASDPFADYECLAVPPDVTACGNPADFGADYVYLLGLYLGDGCLSEHARHVLRLRIFQDGRYKDLIDLCTRTMRAVGGREPGHVSAPGCVEIYAFWKHWACLFPQHARGPKHERSMKLRAWQQNLVDEHPRELLRGLVHSDGSRSINRVHRPLVGGIRTYEYTRYFFTNASEDIRALFAAACSQLGVSCARMTERVLSVARRDSVAFLDTFIGPKS